jgi:hypothetical protein
MSLHSIELLTTSNFWIQLTLLITFGMKPHRKHHFHCYSPIIAWPLHAYQLPDVFTDCYLETGVCLSTYCIEMAILLVCFKVSAQQRVYMPQYYFITLSGARLSPLGTAVTTSLLYQPQMINDGDYGAIRGTKIGRGNQSTQSKPTPVPLCPPQIPYDQTQATAVGSQWLTARAMAQPTHNTQTN